MKNIVFDTNIWITYFLKGKFEDLVRLVYEQDCVIFSSAELIEELTVVLQRKKFSKYLTLPLQEYINFHKELVTIIKTKAIYTESPDSKDNFLFDLALQSPATHLVTGDKILLALQEIGKIKIISLTTFKEQLK